MDHLDSIPAEEFADRLHSWFATAMRPLPWREKYEPYSVWISEIMLQQTQMERGVRYFLAWMRRFPDIRSVAEAGEDAILSAWEGLGYYSRARNLHAAAKCIMRDHAGEFPSSIEAIRRLPGVGEYTAGAIAAIAFNLPEPAVDANVLRIFSRLGDIDRPVAAAETRTRIGDAVRALIPENSPRIFCQALMELGALVCSRNPDCPACPVRDHCAALRNGTVSLRPVKGAKPRNAVFETVVGVILWKGRVLIRKRPAGGLWAGLWELPGGTVEGGEQPEEALSRHMKQLLPRPAPPTERLPPVRYGYTTNRVTAHGFLCTASDDSDFAIDSPPEQGIWVKTDDLGQYAFPGGDRKILERLGWKTCRREPQ